MRTTFSFLIAAALAGCSGTATTIGDTDGGTTTDAGGDAGTTDGALPDGSPGSVCPIDQPAQGAPCTNPNLWCEYGGTGPELLCSTTARCDANAQGKLTWFVQPATSDCVSTPAQNPAACPSTFTGLANGSACPDPNGYTHCIYAEGMCGCLSCMGDAGTIGKEWRCEAYPQPQGCPEPRPRAGSACTQEGQSCTYGGLCDAVSGIPSLRCTNGAWQVEPVAAACAIHQCGK